MIPQNNYKSFYFESIASYYKNQKNINTNAVYIDDITWNDLDMDTVYMRLNNTQTSIGEEYLYLILREIIFKPEILTERNRLINFIQQNTNAEEREKIQFLLAKLSKRKHCFISDYINGNQNGFLRNAFVYKILSLILWKTL